MPLHSLTNFEIQNYCLNEPKFKGFHSINNLPKIKDAAYVINLILIIIKLIMVL